MDVPNPQTQVKEIMRALNAAYLQSANYMNLHQLQSTVDAFRALSSEILVDAASRINSMVPISVLPDDVLLHVFQVATEGCRVCGPSFALASGDASVTGGRVDICPLLTITHTCARWRAVALASSNLWRRIDFRNHGILEMFCQRAKTLPMSFFVDVDSDDRNLVFERIMALSESFAPRVRRLDAVDRFHADPSRPPAWLEDCRFAYLECLNLCVADDPPFDDTEGVSHRVILGQPSHPLKALAISGMGAWLPANQFPQLTHLFLSSNDPESMSTPNFLGILGLLERAPKLEFAHLGNVSSLVEVPETYEPIVLEKLRLLAFTLCDSDALQLLDCIRVPSTAIVRAKAMDFYEETPFPLTSIGSLRTGLSELYIGVSSGNNIVSFAARGASHSFSMNGSEAVSGGPYAWLGNHLRALASSDGSFLKDITTLTMDVPNLDPALIADLLPHTPHLSTLRAWVSFVRLHSHHPSQGPGPAWDVVDNLRVLCVALEDRCPALRVLALAAATPIPNESYRDASIGAFSAMASALEYMLVRRAAAGFDALDELALMLMEDLGKRKSEKEIMEWFMTVFPMLTGLRRYVGSLVVVPPSDVDRVMTRPDMKMWSIDNEEEYWELREDYRIQNLFPV